MPKKTKKTPAPKKSTRKRNRSGLDLDGSITHELPNDTVSNLGSDGSIPSSSLATAGASASQLSSATSSNQVPGVQALHTDKSDAILAYLERLDQSNQALTKRVAELETNRSAPSTPQGARNRFTPQTSAPIASNATVLQQHQAERGNIGVVPTHTYNHASSLLQPSGANITIQGGIGQTLPQGRPQFEAAASQTQFNADGIVPSLSTLRQSSEISQAVNQVLSSYENQARLEATQGKGVKKSGRFNATEAITSSPQLRWPNEGLISVTGKKKVLYDELSISEWAAGQFSNIYLIQDPVLVKQAMLQAIQVLKDATSLPWQAVRTAYAQSMHQVEQGTLSWQDTTQWALNRISSSQVAMANATTLNSQQNNRKICKFYNEGVCTSEGNHGSYRHICSYCARSGKNLVHPETKCMSKQRGQPGHNSNK